MQRGSFVFFIVGVSFGLDVFELVDFPKGGGLLGPVKFLKALCGCRFEEVVIFCDMEGEFSVAVLVPMLRLLDVKSVPCNFIFLAIIVGQHKLDGVFRIEWFSIGKALLR